MIRSRPIHRFESASSTSKWHEIDSFPMSEDEKSRQPLTLRRWSARKLAAAQEATVARPPEAAPAAVPSVALPPNAEPVAEPSPLPPVESLTFDSDFTAFLKPEVDEALKRKALKKLLHDPRFNVMDGLDVYIDDYSKPDPIEPEVVRQLMQARYLFDPPKTRVNERGFVEDVPADVENPAEVVAAEQSTQPIADAEDAAAEAAEPQSPIEPPKTPTRRNRNDDR